MPLGGPGRRDPFKAEGGRGGAADTCKWRRSLGLPGKDWGGDAAARATSTPFCRVLAQQCQGTGDFQGGAGQRGALTIGTGGKLRHPQVSPNTIPEEEYMQMGVGASRLLSPAVLKR